MFAVLLRKRDQAFRDAPRQWHRLTILGALRKSSYLRGQHTRQPDRRAWMALQKGDQLTAVECQQFGRFDRNDAGRPLPAVEQRDLADDLAGPHQRKHHFFAIEARRHDLQRAGENSVELIAGIALAEENFLWRETLRGGGLKKAIELLLVER